MPRVTDLSPIGKTGLELGRLSFGAATQGGLFEAVSEESARAVFQSAWDAGIRYFDTAPWYGYGQSETRLGEFLKDKSGFVLSSKVGRVLEPGIPPHPSQLEKDGSRGFKTDSPLNVRYDYSYEGVMRSFEDSLERMGLERIDTFYIHDPDVLALSVSEVLKGAGKALLELREQGLVRAVGVGMNGWEMPLEFARAGEFDVFLLAGRYTLLEQTSLPFMDYCAARGISVVIGGVYNSGLLASPQPGAFDNYVPVSRERLEKALALNAVCERHGVTLRAAALQLPLAHPAVSSVLCAARTVAQLEDNAEQFEAPIPRQLWDDLRVEGLLEYGVPTPKEQA